MKLFVVWFAILPAAVADLDPGVGQPTQSGKVSGAGFSLGLILLPSPAALFTGSIKSEPEPGLMHRGIAGLSAANATVFARLDGDRTNTPTSSDFLVAAPPVAVVPESESKAAHPLLFYQSGPGKGKNK